MTGARTKRIKRLEAIFPSLTTELTEFTKEAHEGATFHISRNDLMSVWYATPFAMSRDADALEESNYQVIKADLQRISPDGVDDHHFGHWAYGWYDRLYIRKDDALMLQAVQEWINALSDYPVADDMHYSDLEWERNHPGHYAWECYCDDDDCEIKVKLKPATYGELARELGMSWDVFLAWSNLFDQGVEHDDDASDEDLFTLREAHEIEQAHAAADQGTPW